MKDWRRASIIPSFSGGKDSTYLVLRLHELGIKMTDIVYFDTGWEFPHMEGHIAQVEDIIKQKITRLTPRESFDFIFAQKARTRNSQNTRKGYGWPSAMRRWCTGEKTRAINAYVNSLTWQGLSFLPYNASAMPLMSRAAWKSTGQRRLHAFKATPILWWNGESPRNALWRIAGSAA